MGFEIWDYKLEIWDGRTRDFIFEILVLRFEIWDDLRLEIWNFIFEMLDLRLYEIWRLHAKYTPNFCRMSRGEATTNLRLLQ